MSRLLAAAGARNRRDHRGAFEFRPIDNCAEAKLGGTAPYDGKHYLLRDAQGGQHSGRWDGKQFVYSSGARIAREITHYCARTDSGAALSGSEQV